MLRIRLSRVGKKKRPVYRIVVTDSRSPRDGPSVEIIGHYDPLPHPAEIVVKEERAIHWLQVGAQPSEAAAKLLTRLGIMEKAGRQPFLRAPVQAAKTDAKVKVKARAPSVAAARMPVRSVRGSAATVSRAARPIRTGLHNSVRICLRSTRHSTDLANRATPPTWPGPVATARPSRATRPAAAPTMAC